MSDTQNEPLPGEKAIKVKKAGPILLGADRYDIFEKGQKAIREFVEELFRFLIDFPGMMYLVFILTIIVAGENRDKESSVRGSMECGWQWGVYTQSRVGLISNFI